MKSDKLTDDCLIDTICAMRSVLNLGAKDDFSKNADTMLSVLANYLLDAQIDIRSLTLLTPDDMEIMEYDGESQRFIMSCLICLPYADGKLSHKRQQLVDQYADALAVKTNTLSILSLLAKQRIAVSELSQLRQHRDAVVADQVTVKALNSWQLMQSLPTDPQISARYHALSVFPKESFGYALYHFYEAHSLPLPGEKYGVANGLGVIDDMTYVLGGYELDDAGLLYHAFFQAGFTQHDGLLFPLIALMHYYMESVITLGRKKIIPDKDRLLDAYHKGKQMKIDLYDNWDYWQAFSRPIDEVRESLGCADPLC